MESIQYLQEKFLVLMIMFECPGIPGSDQHSRTCSGVDVLMKIMWQENLYIQNESKNVCTFHC